AGLGRTYLPQEDLARFAVSLDDLKSSRRSEAFDRLMEFEIARARAYYDNSAPLTAMIHADSRNAMRALIAIYRTLLDRIAESPADVLIGRVSLPTSQKIWIVLRSAMGL